MIISVKRFLMSLHPPGKARGLWLRVRDSGRHLSGTPGGFRTRATRMQGDREDALEFRRNSARKAQGETW